LTEAFSMMLEAESEPERILAAVREVARGAGPSGMVGGQALDMEYTANRGVSFEQLRGMHARKTGALIRAACVSGALLAGERTDVESAAAYARHVGAAFQIVDDILDVIGDEAVIGKPVGSDEGKGKTTYPGLLGLEESRRLAEAEIQEALASISRYSGPRADFLGELARYIVERAN
jgi:geranylgeranyl diphosphate synthase type II